MLNVWRKPAADHTTRDRRVAIAAAAVLAVVLASTGALIAVAVVDRRDVDWNWTVIADVGGALALGAAALIGAIGGISTLRQRTEADQRAEWWKRAEKCGAYLVDGDADDLDDAYILGSGLLLALRRDDERTGEREKEYLSALTEIIALDGHESARDNGEGPEDGGGNG